MRPLPGFLAAALLLAACGDANESPEARIKALVAGGESAAETRDISALRSLVSNDYRDDRGHDRRTVVRIAQGLFLRNQDIHLFSVVRDLRIEGDLARARILVAMTGEPVESTEALLNVRAELVRFDVTFAREGGEWLVRSADWRRAQLDDFL